MTQGAEVIETGTLLTDKGRTVLVRDDGGTWSLFLEQNPKHWLGQRVTIRGVRYGFASIHVIGMIKGSGVPPRPREMPQWLLWLIFAPILAGLVLMLWQGVRAVSALMA